MAGGKEDEVRDYLAGSAKACFRCLLLWMQLSLPIPFLVSQLLRSELLLLLALLEDAADLHVVFWASGVHYACALRHSESGIVNVVTQ